MKDLARLPSPEEGRVSCLPAQGHSGLGAAAWWSWGDHRMRRVLQGPGRVLLVGMGWRETHQGRFLSTWNQQAPALETGPPCGGLTVNHARAQAWH